MKNISKVVTAMAIIACFALAPSCTEEVSPSGATSYDEISDDVRAKFKDLGFDVRDIKLAHDEHPFLGKTGKTYLLEGDIRISEKALEAMLKSDIHRVGAVGEQYRTTNIVSSPRTIKVLGYTGAPFALTSTMRSALQMAVANYNALDLDLTFTLSFGNTEAAEIAADIVVYKNRRGAGGSAGFPVDGVPYKYVEILSGTGSYGVDVVEHVMTHEIGHCLGLRHTDYFNRVLSCGEEPWDPNEGQADVGAIHIPGTPTGYDANSVMLACFGGGATGEFGNYDKVALEYLY